MVNIGRDLENIRVACRKCASILAELGAAVAPGITTCDIEMLGRSLLERHGVSSAFMGYHGYPAATCVSINSEVVHGLPSKSRFIEPGDIVSVDVGVVYRGCYGDCADTFVAGEAGGDSAVLIDTARDAFQAALGVSYAGNRTGDIGFCVQKLVESRGFSVVKDFSGHGIGRSLHQEPEIPNFGRSGEGRLLKKGMVLAIEPMINRGGSEIDILEDGWTAVTSDGSYSAHYEHCVLITGGIPEVLTRL